jgi:hypothetical protein
MDMVDKLISVYLPTIQSPLFIHSLCQRKLTSTQLNSSLERPFLVL